MALSKILLLSWVSTCKIKLSFCSAEIKLFPDGVSVFLTITTVGQSTK